MKPYSWIILAGLTVATGASAVSGCGSSKSTGNTGIGGEGGDGNTNTTTTSTTGTDTSTTSTDTSTTNTTTATTTTTTGGTCDTSGIDPTCGACLDGSCCPELGACQADAECLDCLSNPNADPNVCAANAQLVSLSDCIGASCDAECNGGGGANPACDAPAVSPSAGACFGALDPANGKPCNPITNEGCDAAAGEACDVNASGFECYPAPNTKALCEACGSAANNDYCQGGMTCVGTCARYCCDDGDCGTGTCDKSATPDPNVGICIQ